LYAIFEAGGNQYKASVGDRVRVDLISDEVGSDVAFEQVMLVAGDEPKIGSPILDGVTVLGKVISHDLGPKVFAYKYQQRNHARRKVGFRRHYTEIEIIEIKGV
jgi:large subunit ribosomal protein L21